MSTWAFSVASTSFLRGWWVAALFLQVLLPVGNVVGKGGLDPSVTQPRELEPSEAKRQVGGDTRQCPTLDSWTCLWQALSR